MGNESALLSHLPFHRSYLRDSKLRHSCDERIARLADEAAHSPHYECPPPCRIYLLIAW